MILALPRYPLGQQPQRGWSFTPPPFLEKNIFVCSIWKEPKKICLFLISESDCFEITIETEKKMAAKITNGGFFRTVGSAVNAPFPLRSPPLLLRRPRENVSPCLFAHPLATPTFSPHPRKASVAAPRCFAIYCPLLF